MPCVVIFLLIIGIITSMKTKRETRQRNVILEELRKVKDHPTADKLYRIVKRRVPSISLGTVYRNLNLLRDEGKIQELTCGKYTSHYDGDVTNHNHFFCIRCRNVFDLDVSALKNLDKRIARRMGFYISYHRLDFYGYCSKCNN